MKLVLLPGLDGTGKLFTPFIEALPDVIEIEVISYEIDREQTYNELVRYVMSKLPNEKFVMLAESFSGPIAYQIALAKPQQLEALILVATFIENPRPFLLQFMPNNRAFANRLPTILIKMFLLGFSAKKTAIDQFSNIIKKVSPNVLAYRLKEIRRLKAEDKELTVKTIYMQATNDKLVPKSAIESWQKVSPHINIVQIEGAHLILQARPEKCARVVEDVLKSHLD